jgi:hypothetical protein
VPIGLDILSYSLVFVSVMFAPAQLSP